MKESFGKLPKGWDLSPAVWLYRPPTGVPLDGTALLNSVTIFKEPQVTWVIISALFWTFWVSSGESPNSSGL